MAFHCNILKMQDGKWIQLFPVIGNISNHMKNNNNNNNNINENIFIQFIVYYSQK